MTGAVISTRNAMPTLAIKLTDPRDHRDWWLRWSTIVDAPTSPALSKEAFARWLREELRRDCPWHAEIPDWDLFLTHTTLPKLLATVERHGTSYPALYRGAAQVIWANRAGDGEMWLPLEGLIDAYREDAGG